MGYLLFILLCPVWHILFGQGGCGASILRTIQKASGHSSDPLWAGGHSRWSQEVAANLIHSKIDILHDIIKNISHFNNKNAKAFSPCISSYNWNTLHQDIIQKNWAILARVWIFFLPSQAAS